MRTILVMALMLAGSGAMAATNHWTGDGADANWSSVLNWSNSVAPVSDSNTWVRLDGTNRLSSSQNIASPFVLNRLESLNGPASGTKPRFNLGGGDLQFAVDGTSQPRIVSSRQGDTWISNAIAIPAGSTLTVDITTFGLFFYGPITGGGSIDKTTGNGSIDLRNGGNSFSGGLTIRAATSEFKRVNVAASGAMGTGPVSLYGGTLATNLANPGGLIFVNTTTHTNPISLFQSSPIFAGLPAATTNVVTLSGTIDLNTNTLHLRGGGTGTINGVISEGGDVAIVKTDDGRWTLGGANTCTGAVVVNAGTLRMDGSIAAASLAVSNGATLGGTGSVAGAATSSGTVIPGWGIGSLSVGSYTQNANGTLAIEIGGTAPGTGHDVLAVAGAARLDGALSVTLTNSFAPASGNSFTVLTASAVSGTFATTNLPALTNGLMWQVGYLANAVVISVYEYLWTGLGANNDWTTAENWINNIAPVSASNAYVKLDGTNRVISIQNIANPFVLNRLDSLNGPASGTKPRFNLGGGDLQFAVDGTTQPRIVSSRQGDTGISNAIAIPAGATLTVDVTTFGVFFYGAITGGGSIDKTTSNGGITLLNSGNSFSGGLTIRAADADFKKVQVTASGAMGTGPVSLYGGTLATNLANPGGLIFFGTTTHTNPVSLFQASPIFAGLPTATTDVVTLSGTIDLNTNTLHLRGGGFGTINGVISEGGDVAIVKTDNGRWTLGGANTCTGAVVVNAGTLRMDGSIAAASLAVSNGATLGGTGSVAGAATSSGTVIPGWGIGSLSVGSYTQNANGTLAIEIGGTAPGTGHDVLAVAGAARLDGALSVTLTNSFAPASGNSFTVLTASAVSGTFATTNLPALTNGLGLDVLYSANTIVISVTGAPPASGFDAYVLQITNAAERGYASDPDNDGYANLLEYATGGSPTNADQFARMNGGRTNGVLALRFTRATNSVDATLYVEGSYALTNNATWAGIAVNSNGVWTGAATVTETGGPDPVNVTVQDTDATATNRSLRLRVTRP